jgi:Holliday junction resolvasome RuvABC endonuclease subunit
MKTLGIDPGTVNLGWCVVKDGFILNCGVARLDKKSPLEVELKRFALSITELFGPFDIVGIERQMKAKMRVVQTHLYHYFKNAKIIAPQSIKRYFNYSGEKSYKQRKKIGVEIMKRICRECKQLNVFEKVIREQNKVDDIADAALISYYIYTENKKVTKKKRKDDLSLSSWRSKHIWHI